LQESGQEFSDLALLLRQRTGEELRAKQPLRLILPVAFFVIFMLLYLVFHSVAETLVLIFPTIYAMSGGLLLQWLLNYNFSVAVAVGYI
jgi:Cu(I)/Ag(I) efflux system membrane protein CusA/SilA